MSPSTDRLNCSVYSWCQPCCFFFFFSFWADVWASRVWLLLPQLTLWLRSRIISTRFPNHDIANMSCSKPYMLGCQLKIPQPLLGANKQQGLTATQCPSPAIIHGEPLACKARKMAQHHMKFNSSSKDTVYSEEIIQATVRGSIFLFPDSSI